jgi:hypothetical protein
VVLTQSPVNRTVATRLSHSQLVKNGAEVTADKSAFSNTHTRHSPHARRQELTRRLDSTQNGILDDEKAAVEARAEAYELPALRVKQEAQSTPMHPTATPVDDASLSLSPSQSPRRRCNSTNQLARCHAPTKPPHRAVQGTTSDTSVYSPWATDDAHPSICTGRRERETRLPLATLQTGSRHATLRYTALRSC